MLNEKATKIAKMKYFQEGEDWEQLCWRVARYISNAENEDVRYEWAAKFYQLIYNKIFLPGGRILANAGTGIKNLMNCVSGDTLIHTENGLIKAKNLSGVVNTLGIDGIFRLANWTSFGKQQLYRITLKNNDILYATDDHEWLVTG